MCTPLLLVIQWLTPSVGSLDMRLAPSRLLLDLALAFGPLWSRRQRSCCPGKFTGIDPRHVVHVHEKTRTSVAA